MSTPLYESLSLTLKTGSFNYLACRLWLAPRAGRCAWGGRGRLLSDCRWTHAVVTKVLGHPPQGSGIRWMPLLLLTAALLPGLLT